jgi:hypothetical protein
MTGCEGDRGPTGPAGVDGNANVHSGTISPTSADWLWNSTYSFRTGEGSTTRYFTRYVDIPDSAITADIISDGMVLMFFEAMPGGGNWAPLPYQFTNFSSTFNYNIVYEVSEGMIRLHYFFTRISATATLPELSTVVIPTYPFRYVVVEGTALQTEGAGLVDLSSHDEVMEFLRTQ